MKSRLFAPGPDDHQPSPVVIGAVWLVLSLILFTLVFLPIFAG